MPQTIFRFASVLSLALLLACRQQVVQPDTAPPDRPLTAPTPQVPGTIRYVLYTDQDFTSYPRDITFSLFARDNHRTLLDTALATMLVRHIPDYAHRMVFDRPIPQSPDSVLVVGFTYYLNGVGYAWHLDTCRSNAQRKVVEYNFR